MKRFLIGIFMTAVAGAAMAAEGGTTPGGDPAMRSIDLQVAKASVDKTKPGWRTNLTMPEVATFDPKHTYFAHVTTNKGPITIKFLPDVAPMHVTSFMYLTKLGFYDGLNFHRVIPGFMAQGGCPLGTGSGGPGYTFDGEFKPNVKHDKPGLLSMANTGRPKSDGSQFFLTFAPTPWLDGRHTIFGEIVEGMDTMKALEKAGTQGGAPTEPLKMEKVTLEVK
jgi:cyclophilin family peptidyl-prolyl cis-trans isomerase